MFIIIYFALTLWVKYSSLLLTILKINILLSESKWKNQNYINHQVIFLLIFDNVIFDNFSTICKNLADKKYVDKLI